jgi:hypothetical protein
MGKPRDVQKGRQWVRLNMQGRGKYVLISEIVTGVFYLRFYALSVRAKASFVSFR